MNILYKRAKTGKIVTWQIDVVDDEIIKTTGQLGTENPIVHRERALPKNLGRSNETSPSEQAQLQAISDWKAKHDDGYKSLDDLKIWPCTVGHLAEHNRYGYPGCGLMYMSLKYALEQTLPQFNTDASGNVKPMLAKTVNWDKVTYPCLVQPKLDGVRCLMVVDYNNSRFDPPIVFLSRKGKEYTTLGHIAQDVSNYCFKKGKQPTSFILDGEVYSDELTFQEIVAAVKKQSPNSLKLKFRAYDVVNEEQQERRVRQFDSWVQAINSPCLVSVPGAKCTSKQEVLEITSNFLAQGYEGSIIRLLGGHYGQGQRSSDLLKVKEFDETEFAFKNFEFGIRGVQDLIAICWMPDGKTEFRASMNGTLAEKKALYERDDLEGCSITIVHFGSTDAGLPRFPKAKNFRDYE